VLVAARGGLVLVVARGGLVLVVARGGLLVLVVARGGLVLARGGLVLIVARGAIQYGIIWCFKVGLRSRRCFNARLDCGRSQARLCVLQQHPGDTRGGADNPSGAHWEGGTTALRTAPIEKWVIGSS
jgi:hypothetical protein